MNVFRRRAEYVEKLSSLIKANSEEEILSFSFRGCSHDHFSTMLEIAEAMLELWMIC